jgi:hypothetical protein
MKHRLLWFLHDCSSKVDCERDSRSLVAKYIASMQFESFCQGVGMYPRATQMKTVRVHFFSHTIEKGRSLESCSSKLARRQTCTPWKHVSGPRGVNSLRWTSIGKRYWLSLVGIVVCSSPLVDCWVTFVRYDSLEPCSCCHFACVGPCRHRIWSSVDVLLLSLVVEVVEVVHRF